MSSFGENIQFYRKRENMTQEQLAEKMEVSRQTISKWEAGNSYPEMEKILQLCELFSCDMDTLMRKNATEAEVGEHQQYEVHMEKRRKQITFGVVLLLVEVGAYNMLEAVGAAEFVLNTIFMAGVIAAVLTLIVAGMQHENFRRKYAYVPEFYSQEVIDKFHESFIIRVAAGVGLILVGLLVAMNGEQFENITGMNEDFFYGIFIWMVAVAVGILVYAGLGKEKYDIASYNKENMLQKENRENEMKIGVWCGCIMLIATIVFLVAGLAFKLWYICWIVYPVGGILCGIVALIFSLKNKEVKES